STRTPTVNGICTSTKSICSTVSVTSSTPTAPTSSGRTRCGTRTSCESPRPSCGSCATTSGCPGKPRCSQTQTASSWADASGTDARPRSLRTASVAGRPRSHLRYADAGPAATCRGSDGNGWRRWDTTSTNYAPNSRQHRPRSTVWPSTRRACSMARRGRGSSPCSFATRSAGCATGAASTPTPEPRSLPAPSEKTAVCTHPGAFGHGAQERRREGATLQADVPPRRASQRRPPRPAPWMGVQRVPRLGQVGAFEVEDPRRGSGAVGRVRAQHVLRQLGLDPQRLLRVPAGVERVPSAREHEVEHVLVGPLEVYSPIPGDGEQGFRDALGPEPVEVQ